MRFFLILQSALLCLVFSACTLMSKKQAPVATPNAHNEIKRAEAEINAGKTKIAIARLKKVLVQHNNTDVTDDAYLLLGNLYYKQGSYDDSYRSFLSITDAQYTSPLESMALFGTARALYKLGRYDESLNITKQLFGKRDLNPELLTELHILRYNLQVHMGGKLDALKSLIYLTEVSTDPDKKTRYRIKALELVESTLKETDLQTVANDASYGFVRGHALYRVATSYFEQRDYSRAENYFLEVLDLLPNTDFAQNSQNFLNQIAARKRVSPLTIGAVLPLTGKHSSIAQKTLRGLQMGLGIYGSKPSDFKLAIIDSETNPDVARRGVERLVIEDGAIAIVGDLLSKTAEPVAQKADELGIPVIGLSQKSGLTRIGDNVFRNALTSSSIVRALVQNAIDVQGMSRFAILYPNDPYGVEFANLFWDEVLARGGQITAAQSYASNEKDFAAPISRLVGTYYLENRTEEYAALIKNWYSNQKTITARVTPPTDLLPPVIDFDALFIPDGVKALGQIAPMLVYNDVSQVRLLGTNLWNNSELIERGTSLIENALFVDALSSVDSEFQRTSFYKLYKTTFGDEPTSFSAQAYDIGLALREAILRGARTRVALREALASLQNFSGTVGSISVNAEREFTRPLVLLTVKNGKIEQAATK